MSKRPQKTLDGWTHSPWWKVVINTFLRSMQRRRKYRWLIVTKINTESFIHGRPIVTGYGFRKVEMRNAP